MATVIGPQSADGQDGRKRLPTRRKGGGGTNRQHYAWQSGNLKNQQRLFSLVPSRRHNWQRGRFRIQPGLPCWPRWRVLPCCMLRPWRVGGGGGNWKRRRVWLVLSVGTRRRCGPACVRNNSRLSGGLEVLDCRVACAIRCQQAATGVLAVTTQLGSDSAQSSGKIVLRLAMIAVKTGFVNEQV